MISTSFKFTFLNFINAIILFFLEFIPPCKRQLMYVMLTFLKKRKARRNFGRIMPQRKWLFSIAVNCVDDILHGTRHFNFFFQLELSISRAIGRSGFSRPSYNVWRWWVHTVAWGKQGWFWKNYIRVKGNFFIVKLLFLKKFFWDDYCYYF